MLARPDEPDHENVVQIVLTDARETVVQSVIKDTFTFIMVVGILSVGVATNSSAMQWVGFIMLAFLFIAKCISVIHGTKKLTIEQARKKLDEMERSGS